MIDKKYINEFIRLKWILTDQDKADILLAASGFKPAAMVEVSYFKNNKISKKEFLELVSKSKKILNNLNLIFEINVNYPKNRNQITKYSFIAKDKKIFQKLKKASFKKDIKMRRLEIGLLLGYPKSSVEAFADNKSVFVKDIPKKILNSNAFKFLNFRLSNKWKEEIRYLKIKAMAIKKISPELYKKIIYKID